MLLYNRGSKLETHGTKLDCIMIRMTAQTRASNIENHKKPWIYEAEIILLS